MGHVAAYVDLGWPAYQSLEQRTELVSHGDASGFAVVFERLVDVVPKFLHQVGDQRREAGVSSIAFSFGMPSLASCLG